MKINPKLLVVLRLSMGVVFLYAGLSKVLNPEWTAAGFLNHAQSLESFYAWFASEGNIGWVNFLNQWGLTAIGLGLITGLLTRAACVAGILLMALYYFPSLHFPYVGEHSFLIDDHVVYAVVLAVLYQTKSGTYFGLDKFVGKKK